MRQQRRRRAKTASDRRRSRSRSVIPDSDSVSVSELTQHQQRQQPIPQQQQQQQQQQLSSANIVDAHAGTAANANANAGIIAHASGVHARAPGDVDAPVDATALTNVDDADVDADAAALDANGNDVDTHAGAVPTLVADNSSTHDDLKPDNITLGRSHSRVRQRYRSRSRGSGERHRRRRSPSRYSSSGRSSRFSSDREHSRGRSRRRHSGARRRHSRSRGGSRRRRHSSSRDRSRRRRSRSRGSRHRRSRSRGSRRRRSRSRGRRYCSRSSSRDRWSSPTYSRSGSRSHSRVRDSDPHNASSFGRIQQSGQEESRQSDAMQADLRARGNQYQVPVSSQRHLSSVRKDVSSVVTSQDHGGVLHRPVTNVSSQGPDSLRRQDDVSAVPVTQQDQWNVFLAMQQSAFQAFLDSQRPPDAQPQRPLSTRDISGGSSDVNPSGLTQVDVDVLLQKTPSPAPSHVVDQTQSCPSDSHPSPARDIDDDCTIISAHLQPTTSEVSTAPATTSDVRSASTVTPDFPESRELRELRLKLEMERELAQLRSVGAQPPPVQRSASVSDDPPLQSAPPVGRDTLMSRRLPINKDFINQLSPVRAPFNRLMGSGRVQTTPSSPSSLSIPEGQDRQDDNLFRTSIKVLLDYLPDVSSTAPREKVKLPAHFETLYKSTGKPKILLPPHPHVASNYQFVQDSYVASKKNESGQYKGTVNYSPTDVFEPKKFWSRAETSFNAGPDVSFLQRDHTIDNAAQKLFNFKSIQNFRQPLNRPYQLNRSSAAALIRNTKNGIASASYGAHFLEGLKLCLAELSSSINSASAPEGLSDDVQKWFDDLQENLSTSALRAETLLQGAFYSSKFAASFHVFNDVLESQFRRDQYLSHIKPFLQHHRLELRDATFASNNVFPCLGDILTQADQESSQSATFAIADALASGWRSGQSGDARRQDNRDNRGQQNRDRDFRDNRSRRDNRDNNKSRNRSRSRNRRDSGQRVRRDYSRDRDNQGRNFQGNRGNNRGNYQSRSSRRNQRQGNVPGGSQDQQPKSLQQPQPQSK